MSQEFTLVHLLSECVLVPGSHECHARVGRQRCGIGSHHGWAWRLWAVASLKRPKEHLTKKKADGNS